MKKTTALLLACAFALLWAAPGAAAGEQTEAIIKSIIEGKSAEAPAAEKKAPPTEKKAPVNATVKKEKSESPQAPPPDELLLKTGIQLYGAGMTEAALARFRELKTKYPQSQFKDSASVWSGRIYYNANKLPEAVKEFTSVGEESGEYPAAVYHLAETHYRAGNTAAAIEHFYKVASQFPEHERADDAQLFCATIFLNEMKGAQALDAAVKIIRFYPDRETVDDAYYLIGKVYERDPTLRDMEIARRVYKSFLKKANEEKTAPFANSPLKVRVERDLRAIEATYFKMER